MAGLDPITDRVRVVAGADFAFVLTRRGRLVTKNAPQEMPEEGRKGIVELAEELLRTGQAFAHCEMPREAIVPFGGAAPVDMYVAPREHAILCVVMATFAPQDNVGPAVSEGLAALDDLLGSEGERRLRMKGLKAKPAKRASQPGSRTLPPGAKMEADFDEPAPRGTAPFLMPYRPASFKKAEPPPEISVTEASVGRNTLAAIEVDATGPEITYGFSPIGRQTIAEIERSMIPQGDPRTSVPDVRVSLASMPELDVKNLDPIDRHTLPFTETATEAKRVFDASKSEDAVTVEEPKAADAPRLKWSVPNPPSNTAHTVSSTPQRTVIVGRSGPAPRAGNALGKLGMGATKSPAPPKATPSAAAFGTKRNSNIDLWHQALGDLDKPKKPVVHDSQRDTDPDPHDLIRQDPRLEIQGLPIEPVEPIGPSPPASEPTQSTVRSKTRPPPAAAFPKRKATGRGPASNRKQ